MRYASHTKSPDLSNPHIQLFDVYTAFGYLQCLSTAKLTAVLSLQVLGVVGYPGDLSDPATGEKGAFMHEMFLPTEFDLAQQADTMLEYQIDTFGGKSISRHQTQRVLKANVQAIRGLLFCDRLIWFLLAPTSMEEHLIQLRRSENMETLTTTISQLLAFVYPMTHST